MTKPQDPVRQILIQARRDQILTAAADVFSKKGFQGATIKAIATTAHVSEGTLYNYFASKHEILVAIADEVELPEMLQMLENVDLGNRGAMVAMVELGLDLSEARLHFIRTVISEAWLGNHTLIARVADQMKRIHERLKEYISKSITDGLARPLDPGVGASMILSMFGGLLLPHLQNTESQPTSQEERHVLATTMVDMLLDGILLREAEEPTR